MRQSAGIFASPISINFLKSETTKAALSKAAINAAEYVPSPNPWSTLASSIANLTARSGYAGASVAHTSVLIHAPLECFQGFCKSPQIGGIIPFSIFLRAMPYSFQYPVIKESQYSPRTSDVIFLGPSNSTACNHTSCKSRSSFGSGSPDFVANPFTSSTSLFPS